MYKKINAIRVDTEKYQIEEKIVEDAEIELIINDLNFGRFSVSPDFLEEFAIGYLIGGGLVNSQEDIMSIKIKDKIIEIEVKSEDFNIRRELVMSSDCFGGFRQKVELLEKIESDYKITKEQIIESSKKLRDESFVWKQTGGTHNAALVNQEDFISIEDVSRHVAIDKVIGAASLRGIDFSHSYLVSSGRMPSDMVMKVARVGIPILTSKAAPTVSGMIAGEKSGLTLVGFVRGNRFNIYSHPHRIIV